MERVDCMQRKDKKVALHQEMICIPLIIPIFPLFYYAFFPFSIKFCQQRKKTVLVPFV